ncbi:hypothetical protein ACF09J_23845 [Streptomyces sp. NPDC014889]|uniref:hypothetical protein n=1 Tax=Streptomyces sp. NPDC014889 TaxID=3364928 RepID=UPI0036FA4855
MVVSRSLARSAVDHTVYDTTSVIATIERGYGLKPVATRDAVVNDLSPAVAAGGRGTRWRLPAAALPPGDRRHGAAR